MAAEASRQSKNDLPPLPNLEGKIICADTLGTVADHRWKPLGDGTLQVTMREVNDALLRVAPNQGRMADGARRGEKARAQNER